MAIIKTIWQNKRHFKMQIFGVAVLALLLVFFLNFMTIIVSHSKQVNEYMKSNVKFTSSYQMSLSGVRGSVNDIYIDKSKTQCFVLLNMGDVSNLTMNASNYQVMITDTNTDGVREDVPDEKISGQIYVFGSTGLMGIYLKSDVPFENNMKQLTLRSYTKFTSGTKPYFRKSASDAEYDQCHIYFNPGGTNAQTIEFLETHVDGTDFNPTDVYRQVKTVTKETEYRTTILETYQELETKMNQIVEYRTRLSENYKILVPDLPMWLTGDYFKNIQVKDDEGNILGSYKRFMPATITPGGTDFDWFNGSILKGYFALVPDAQGMSIRDYIYSLQSDKASRKIDETKITEWLYADGTAVLLKADSTTTTYEQTVMSDIKLYEKAVSDYITLKSKYQSEYLPNLLLLELDSGSIGETYTVRGDENAIVLY